MKQLSVRKKFAKRGNTLLHIDAGFPLAPAVQVTNLSCIPARVFPQRSSGGSEQLINVMRPRPKATQHKLTQRGAALLRLKRLNEHSMLDISSIADSTPHSQLNPNTHPHPYPQVGAESLREGAGATLCVVPGKRYPVQSNLKLARGIAPQADIGVQARPIPKRCRSRSRYKKIVSNSLYSREYRQHRLKALELSELQEQLHRPKHPAITITKLVHDKRRRLRRYRLPPLPELSLPQIILSNGQSMDTSKTPRHERNLAYIRSRQFTQDLNLPKSLTGDVLYGGCELPPLATVLNVDHSPPLSRKIKVNIELSQLTHASTRAPQHNTSVLDNSAILGDGNESVDEFNPIY
jgi:hypothetical protein